MSNLVSPGVALFARPKPGARKYFWHPKRVPRPFAFFRTRKIRTAATGSSDSLAKRFTRWPANCGIEELMAYRPNVIRPPVQRHPRELLEARMQRQALVKALSDRLAKLLAAFQSVGQQSPQAGFPAQGPSPNVPARPSFQGSSSPLAAPAVSPSVQQPWVPSWPPPSAQDWRRMPGFNGAREVQ